MTPSGTTPRRPPAPHGPAEPLAWRQLGRLPNLVSLVRVPLALLFLIERDVTVRLVLIGAAAASDFLDGYLARRHGRTRLGAVLDPVTDKTFLVTALLSLAVNGPLGAGELLVLLSRDIAVTFGFAIVLLRRAPMRFSARLPGKTVTVLQLAALVALTARPQWALPVVIAVGIASAVAILDYGTQAVRALRGRAAAH